MSDDITIRLYQPGDEHAILALREELTEIEATDKSTLDHWRHETLENPAGPPLIPLAATPDGRVLSHVTMLPRRLEALGRQVLAYQWIDVMTHPAHRKKNLLTKVELHGEEHAASRNCAYFLGFPNSNSFYPYVKKYHSHVVTPVPILVRPLSPAGPITPHPIRSARAAALHTLSTIYHGHSLAPQVTRIRTFDDTFTPLLQSFAAAHPVHFARTVPLLNWRYTNVPKRTYRLYRLGPPDDPTAVAILRVTTHRNVRICILMDLITTTDTPDIPRFVRHILRLTTQEDGTQLAFAMFLSHTPQSRIARQAGFVHIPRRVSPYRITQIGKATDHWPHDPAPLYDPTSWYVSFGDNDVF